MKYWQKIFSLLAILLVANAYAADENSPLGYWKTIDDVTGKPKSILHISAMPDHTLQGKILKIFPSPGKDENEVCSACKDEKHNQRMEGMVILTGMKADTNNKWDGGKILDPVNGKYYRCIIMPINNGKQLSVRGYIGFPLLGRSQTWERVEGMTD